MGRPRSWKRRGGRRFRSETRIVPCPSVIRLVRYVHVPRRFRRQVTNTFLFARDDYSCQYCGRQKNELRGRQFLTRDHIVPLSRGGDTTWENVVTSCSPCNNRKGNRLPGEAGLKLLNKPGQPNYVHLVWVVRRGNRSAGEVHSHVLWRARARRGV